MLHGGIRQSFDSGTGAARSHARDCNWWRSPEPPRTRRRSQAAATLFSTDVATFEATESLREEVFGPTSIVTHCGSKADLERIAESFNGQLTAAIHGTPDDLREHARLVRILERKAGPHHLQRLRHRHRSLSLDAPRRPLSLGHAQFLHQHRHRGDLPLRAAGVLPGFPGRLSAGADSEQERHRAWRMVDGEITQADA